MTTTIFNPRTASAAECRASNDRASFTVGETVTVNDPAWYRHGSKGTVTKVEDGVATVAIEATCGEDKVLGAAKAEVSLG